MTSGPFKLKDQKIPLERFRIFSINTFCGVASSQSSKLHFDYGFVTGGTFVVFRMTAPTNTLSCAREKDGLASRERGNERARQKRQVYKYICTYVYIHTYMNTCMNTYT